MSVLTPILQPALRTALNSITGILRRYFTKFDDVSNTHITLDQPIPITSEFEIEFYTMQTESRVWSSFLGGDDFSLRLQGADGRISFYLYNAKVDNTFDLRSDDPIPLHQWVKVNVIHSATGTTMIINDTIAKHDPTDRDFTQTNIRYIGRGGHQIKGGPLGAGWVRGYLRDVKVWTGGTQRTGNLVLDMPIDKQYNAGDSVSNRVGANQGTAQNFTPTDSRLFTYRDEYLAWTHLLDSYHTKNLSEPTPGTLFYSFSPPPFNTGDYRLTEAKQPIPAKYSLSNEWYVLNAPFDIHTRSYLQHGNTSILKSKMDMTYFNLYTNSAGYEGDVDVSVYENIDTPVKRHFLYFDNVAQTYIQLSQPITLTGDYEISFDSQILDGGGYLLADTASALGYDRLLLNTATDRLLYGFGFNGEATGLTTSNDMHHFVLKRVGNLTTLTVDGNVVATTTVYVTPTFNAIGAQYGGSTGVPFLKGIFANLKVIHQNQLILDMPLDNGPMPAGVAFTNNTVMPTAGDSVDLTSGVFVDSVGQAVKSHLQFKTTAGAYKGYKISNLPAQYNCWKIEFDVVHTETAGFEINIYDADNSLITQFNDPRYKQGRHVIYVNQAVSALYFRCPDAYETMILENLKITPINNGALFGELMNFTADDAELFETLNNIDWTGPEVFPSLSDTSGWLTSASTSVSYADGELTATNTNPTTTYDVYKPVLEEGKSYRVDIHPTAITGDVKTIAGWGYKGLSWNLQVRKDRFDVTAHESQSAGVRLYPSASITFKKLSYKRILKVAV
ncbi:hypothetical protein IT774_07525 [Salinimonas marina]|uniref:Uncharacterized protein n=1 Tax=Salinimonas marina TaxID=2785918 RepID=A0A7S9DZT0_9ALTE|nr:LamG-like jellyroll fold domain-containing protein [Salinimonas marina]QPG06944.1 hypothetical protein IT774_07525 [Salinimonas marina]